MIEVFSDVLKHFTGQLGFFEPVYRRVRRTFGAMINAQYRHDDHRPDRQGRKDLSQGETRRRRGCDEKLLYLMMDGLIRHRFF